VETSARRSYAVLVTTVLTSFADGTPLCLLVHRLGIVYLLIFFLTGVPISSVSSMGRTCFWGDARCARSCAAVVTRLFTVIERYHTSHSKANDIIMIA